MSEKTLNEALSGSEIKEIILQEIGKRLDGDTTLENDLAYAGFFTRFEINVTFLRSLTKPTMVWGGAVQGMVLGTDVPEGTEVNRIAITDTHTSAESPDIERQNHDLAIPVMVQTPSGMERKKVHVGRGPGRPPKVRE